MAKVKKVVKNLKKKLTKEEIEELALNSQVEDVLLEAEANPVAVDTSSLPHFADATGGAGAAKASLLGSEGAAAGATAGIARLSTGAMLGIGALAVGGIAGIAGGGGGGGTTPPPTSPTIALDSDTGISSNSGVSCSSDNYGVSTVDLSFYSWNGLTGYDTVQKNISDKNLTVYLNVDSEFNTNAQILESDGSTVWMHASQNPTTKMIDDWIDQILDYNAHGGKILGLSLDIEPWVKFTDQNDPANKDEWQEFLDFVSYVSQSVHENNLELSISMPFWLDSINNDVFPNDRPIIYDIIDISDEVIIMDYTTNQTNFVNFVSNELAYADSVDKSIKLAIETTDLGDDNLSFYNNPQEIIPFLQTSFSNKSFDGYVIHAMDTFATLNPAVVI